MSADQFLELTISQKGIYGTIHTRNCKRMQSPRPSNDADNIFSVNYEDTKKSRRKGRRTNEPFSNIASFVYRVKQLGFTSFLADYFAPHTVQGLCILFNI